MKKKKKVSPVRLYQIKGLEDKEDVLKHTVMIKKKTKKYKGNMQDIQNTIKRTSL
jgi:hypothetical protein